MLARVMLFLAMLAAFSPARAETVLEFSETAGVMVQPDEIAASLHAEATASEPADAQEAVNRTMAKALDTARQVQGVTPATGQYAVWPASAQFSSKAPAWRASQTLDLSAQDGPPLLHLVGALQKQGLVVQQLGWRLSTQAARTAREQALRHALGGLRKRAEEAAGLLALRFVSFRTVRLTPEPPPVMPLRAAMTAAPEPSVEQGPVEVTATVTAEAVLAPAQP
ncbi:MAG: SIMPL domain-containing protein [Solirubrobacterales bacterium]|nr:SIMPL domain-containing protein [Solirubrobacterales bacterium]